MPRIRHPTPPARGVTGDDLVEFGREPDDPEIELPPMPSAIVESAAPPPPSMAALGQPPDDPMAQAAWARKLLMLQAWETTLDSTLSQTVRRKEVRSILRDAARHMTDAMRYDVKKLIEAQRSSLEARKRGKAHAKMEARKPGAAGAKVIPIRRG